MTLELPPIKKATPVSLNEDDGDMYDDESGSYFIRREVEAERSCWLAREEATKQKLEELIKASTNLEELLVDRINETVKHDCEKGAHCIHFLRLDEAINFFEVERIVLTKLAGALGVKKEEKKIDGR